MPDIESEISRFIADRFLFGDETKLSVQDSLLEAGIVDSTGILEIIAFLEQQYEIKVDDDEIIPENLDTIGAISAYLSKKMSP